MNVKRNDDGPAVIVTNVVAERRNRVLPAALLIVAHAITPASPQAISAIVDQPKVNTNASTPASRNSISNS